MATEQEKESMATESASLKSDVVFDQMKQHLETDAGKEIVKNTGLVYEFHIAPEKLGYNEIIYTVDLKKGEVTKGPYKGGNPDATFSFKDDDFVEIVLGKLNPQLAFMSGKIKIKGSLSAAQKFSPDIFLKLVKI
ncbi:sterol carrier protein 2 [Stylosanthes scabra]|uniref:Sterol carrier protein 2 n=1 Tax=Stylosanthes scabra TaxID=79078 RepID=A0ABU6U9A5_9FABA|nr:sterol carrier protein 2 [Stylosanthes scabra]